MRVKTNNNDNCAALRCAAVLIRDGASFDGCFYITKVAIL